MMMSYLINVKSMSCFVFSELFEFVLMIDKDLFQFFQSNSLKKILQHPSDLCLPVPVADCLKICGRKIY